MGKSWYWGEGKGSQEQRFPQLQRLLMLRGVEDAGTHILVLLSVFLASPPSLSFLLTALQ